MSAGIGDAREIQFTRNIGPVRRARNMSQEDLATACRLNRDAITAMENGRRRVRLGEAIAIAHTLGTTVEEMTGDQPVTITITV